MNVSHGIAGLRALAPGSVLSIGNFDGVHLGHRHLLSLARSLRTSGEKIVAVTFEPHPLTVLRPELAPPRLTPPAIKEQLLGEQGVDELVVLPPTHDVLDLTAEQFWAILREDVKPSQMIEGASFNFGKARRGTIERLREWTAQSAIRLHLVDSVKVALLDLSVVSISSSLIRWLLTHGRVRDASICLGRSYALTGSVIEGHQRGRTIGVPTANLRCDDQLVPCDGVYAGRSTIHGRTYAAAISIGVLPTFGDQQRQVEAHLIGFDGNLYQQTITVELVDWIREQRKFPDVGALTAQIQRDLILAHSLGLQQRHQPIAAA